MVLRRIPRVVWDLGSRVRRERKSGNALRTAGPFKTTKCSNGSLRLLCDERIDCCKRRRRGDGGWMQHSSGGWYTTRGKVEKKRVVSVYAYMRCHSARVPKSRVDDLGQGSSRLHCFRAIQPLSSPRQSCSALHPNYAHPSSSIFFLSTAPKPTAMTNWCNLGSRLSKLSFNVRLLSFLLSQLI